MSENLQKVVELNGKLLHIAGMQLESYRRLFKLYTGFKCLLAISVILNLFLLWSLILWK